jgi:AraC-like DNA-binding protein
MADLHENRRSSSEVTFGLVSQYVRPFAKQQSHHHSEIELNFVEQGCLIYTYGNQQIELSAGRLAVFWGSIPHHISKLDQTISMYWLTLPLAVFTRWDLPESFTQQILSGAFLVEPGAAQPDVDLIFFQRWQTDLISASEGRKKILLLEIEARLHRLAYKTEIKRNNHSPTQTAGDESPGLTKARKMAGYILTHYTQLISIDQVAEAAGLNPDYAMRLFRRHFQVSILEYLTRYRLAHAQRLLITTSKPVAEVALESGFGSTSQFYATFKGAFGSPPGKFRGQNRRL